MWMKIEISLEFPMRLAFDLVKRYSRENIDGEEDAFVIIISI